MPKVSSQYKEKKTQFIIESAISCFTEKGYQATTIDDIATRSKTSKGAIYGYFSSKEDIILQVMEQNTQQHFQSIEAGLEKLEHPIDKIRFILKKFQSPIATKDLDKFRIHIEFFLNSSRNERFFAYTQQRHRQYIDLIVTIVREGQRKGIFRASLQPELVSSMFWSIRDGTLLHGIATLEHELYLSMWNEVEMMLLRYLKEPEPANGNS